MKSCDICGKKTYMLEELKSIYQTKTIKYICPDCQKPVDKHLKELQGFIFKMHEKVRSVQRGLLKRYLRCMKNKLTK